MACRVLSIAGSFEMIFNRALEAHVPEQMLRLILITFSRPICLALWVTTHGRRDLATGPYYLLLFVTTFQLSYWNDYTEGRLTTNRRSNGQRQDLFASFCANSENSTIAHIFTAQHVCGIVSVRTWAILCMGGIIIWSRFPPGAEATFLRTTAPMGYIRIKSTCSTTASLEMLKNARLPPGQSSGPDCSWCG